MPGSEVALTELTAALFGQMQMDGQVEVLMDDIYIGADSPEELLARWEKAPRHMRKGRHQTRTKEGHHCPQDNKNPWLDLAPRRETKP